MKTIIYNLTPHQIRVQISECESIVFPSHGQLRLAEAVEQSLRKAYGVPVVKKRLGEPQLTISDPDPKATKEELQEWLQQEEPIILVLIVSYPVLQALTLRFDLQEDIIRALLKHYSFDLPSGFPFRWEFVCPDTGPESAIRSSDGKIVAVKRLMSLV